MKRFLSLTLALLLATTGLVITAANAYHSDLREAYKFGGKVYGYTYVVTRYDSDTQRFVSDHTVYVHNYGPGWVKFYAKFQAGVSWNGGFENSPIHEDSDELAGNRTDSSQKRFTFSMRNKPDGWASVWGTSALNVRDFASNNKEFWDTASSTTRFRLR